MAGHARRTRIVLGLIRVDVVSAFSFTNSFEAVPVAIGSSERIVGGSRWAGARRGGTGDPLVGASLASHGRRVRVVVGFLLVKGEGFLQVTNTDVERRVHPVNLGVDREVVVSDRTDKEGAVEGDRPGVIRLVSERTGCRGRDRVGSVVPVVGVVVVSGHVVVPGHASSNVGPVVAVIRNIRVKPVLGITRAISDGALVRIRGVVVGHSADDTEVRVVSNNGASVRAGVVEDGLTDSTFGAIKGDAVGTGGLEGSLGPRDSGHHHEAGEGETGQSGSDDSTHGKPVSARRTDRSAGHVAGRRRMVVSVGNASILDAALHVGESHTAPTLIWLPTHHNNGT